ncbi:MAG: Ig-like domain-containing protein, partial [Clostridia bacterium]|nr:Ig-like domain-containing protein [Clostridia bacterium]
AIYKEIKITVTEKEVLPTSVSFDATPTAAVVGGKYTLFVTVLPEDAKNYAVTFTSSNTAVATVDEEGRLTYVGAGETVITVKCVADESVTASFTLTVTAANDTTNDTANSTSDDTKGGCSGSLGGALCVLPMLGVAFVAMKKKKD